MTVKYYHDLMQGGEEWHELRTGLLTASQMKLVITPTLKIAGNEKTRAYLYELVAQRASNFVEPHYESWDMQRGKVEEIYAKDLYSEHYAQVRDCGFVTNDRWGFTIGFSPDGLVGEDGLIEAKSRCQKYQVQTIIENEMPKDFMLQIQSGLLVTEREWCDFISYSNGLPMFVKRIHPDEKVQAAIEEAAHEFEKQAAENLKLYFSNSEALIQTERREWDDGAMITPSSNADPEVLMAG